MRKPKIVTFKLLDKTKQSIVGKGDVEVTWGNATLSPTYLSRDKNFVATQHTISVAETIHPKSGVRVSVPIGPINFVDGVLRLAEGKDDVVIKGLRATVNNIGAPNRLPSDKAIFYEFDAAKERRASVGINELIAEAYAMIKTASVEEILEYAKAIGGIATEEVEELLAGKDKDKSKIKVTEAYKALTDDMKVFANKDPQSFMDSFNDESRSYLAAINDAVAKRVIGYGGAAREFFWIVGNSQHAFAKVPKGVPVTNNVKWLADHLMDGENEATYNELLQKLKAAS